MKAFTLFCGILVLVCCAVGLSSAEIYDAFKEFGEVCVKETGLDEAEFAQFGKPDFKPEDVSENMKCTMNCVMTRAGYLDESGQIKPEALKPTLSDEAQKKFDEIFAKCKTESDPDPCETTYKTFVCMMDEKSKMR